MAFALHGTLLEHLALMWAGFDIHEEKRRGRSASAIGTGVVSARWRTVHAGSTDDAIRLLDRRYGSQGLLDRGDIVETGSTKAGSN
jgi:hypothetical protein